MWARGPALCKSLCAVRWGPDKSGKWDPGEPGRGSESDQKEGEDVQKGFPDRGPTKSLAPGPFIQPLEQPRTVAR